MEFGPNRSHTQNLMSRENVRSGEITNETNCVAFFDVDAIAAAVVVVVGRSKR